MVLETNVIAEYLYVGFIENKFISGSNIQEPNLIVMILSSTLSEKHKNLEVQVNLDGVKELKRKYA